MAQTTEQIMDMIEAWHEAEMADPEQLGMLADIERALNQRTFITADLRAQIQKKQAVMAAVKSLIDALEDPANGGV